MPEMTTRALLDVLALSYGGRGIALTPFYAEPDHAVYRVDRTNGAPWVVRHFSSTRRYSDVEGDADVLDHVRHLRVEQIVHTKAGNGAARADGRGVIVTELEEGPLASPSPQTLLEVGATLGALHRLQPARTPGVTRRAGSLPREDLALGRRYLSDIAEDVPDDQRDAYWRLDRDLASTSDCADLPHTLVHSDCHLGNVIQTARGAVLIDWQNAGQGPAIASLGWLLYSAAIQSPAGPVEEFDPLRVDAVLQGYCQHRTPHPDELARLADAMRFRPLVIAARAFRESIKTKTPAAATGWWSRYAKAEAVAHRANEYCAHER